MKICFLAGASSIHTVRWVNAMADIGHEVSLLTIHHSEMDEVDERVAVYKLKVKNKFGYYLNFLEAKCIIKKIKPDIVNVHYASGYGTLGRLLNFKPTLLSVWGSDVYLYPYQSKLNERTLKKNLHSADQIASTSRAMKVQTELFITPRIPIAVTPFGIDLNCFKPDRNIQSNEIVIGTVKRLENIYGIDILIRAVSKLKKRLHNEGKLELGEKVRLKIVGEGSELQSLMQLAKDEKINEITKFVGAVANIEVPNYLNQFDVYCAFSRSESFGVAVLEASACEVPVVVSGVGGLPEVVKDGETGFIVNHENLTEIVEKLYLLVTDKEKRIEMGRRALDFVSEHYDWDKNVTHMERVYDKLIKRQNKEK